VALPIDMQYWVFANKAPGTYEDSDWDMTTILANQRYYFTRDERNRSSVVAGASHTCGSMVIPISADAGLANGKTIQNQKSNTNTHAVALR
jgi:hypothetical protein